MRVAKPLEVGPCSLGVRATVTWPCLARAVLARQRPSAEANLVLSIALSGPEDRLRGTLRSLVTTSATSGADPTEGGSKTILERTATASLRRFSGEFAAWIALDVTVDGGPFVELMVKHWGTPGNHLAPAYVRTNLPVLLGLDGGRYGCATVELATDDR